MTQFNNGLVKNGLKPERDELFTSCVDGSLSNNDSLLFAEPTWFQWNSFLNFHPTWWDFIFLKNGWLHLKNSGCNRICESTAIFNPFIYASCSWCWLFKSLTMILCTRQWSFMFRKVFGCFQSTNGWENVTKGIDELGFIDKREIRRKL